MIYYVIEFQTNNTGAVLTWSYDNRESAEEKYFSIMKAAAKSNVKKHGAIIITEDLFQLKGELAYRSPAQNGE